AEAVYRRALAAAESGFGDDDETVADVLNFLAVRALARGAVEEARDFGGRAYHIEQGVAHARHPDAATDQDAEVDLGLDGDAIYDTSILVAGRILEAEGDVEGAIRAYRAVIASLENKKGRERLLGEAFERLARALMQTQEFRDAQGDVRREAVDLAHRAHDTLEGVLGPDHPLVLATDSLIADTEFYFSDAALAEGWMSDAVDRLARQIDAIGRAGRAEQRAARALFLADVRLLVGLKSQAQFIGVARDFLEGPYRPPNPEMALGASPTLGLSNADVGSFDWDKPYAAMQWAKSSDTAAAVAHMAARFATGNDDPGLAKLVRERAAARERLDEIDGGLLTDADKAASDRDLAAERDRRAEADKLANELAADDAELARRFPRYAELVKPQPIGIAETQKLLAPDEAMLVFAVGDDDAYVAVVGARSFGLYPLAANDAGSFALNEPTLEDWVAKVRPRYDEKKSQLAPFDAATAFALYHALFGPAEKQLQGIRQLYIVGEGPLDSLPWDALLTAKPAAATLATPTQLRAAPWLAKRYAVTVLPSASSLRMLREFAQGSPAPLPFLGIGDPLLKDHPPAAGEARGIDIDAAFRGGAVDVAALRDLPSLPETAHELEVEAQLFNAGTDSLMLRQSATVTAVKHADLADRRIVSFATHGLVAGDVGVAEPGLVLTPPPQPTPEDDGLLKASEIAQLKLNADMVILSACDTAATDGKPDAEGFSGLAKAFFYAGARSLLVSNWDVVSTSTVELMTRVAAHLDERGIGRAEALRRAALDVMNDRAHPEFAHPLFWAPFVVVGEGGAE
ncbi:MAG TPA: CHAT domain-containing protein, partial [Stellaceae bacterium]|nr:CHAT domain-containing protein [Stellaceae bacterium]